MSDLINRADAIEAVAKAKAIDPFGRYDKQNIGVDWALDALSALPSADRSTGEWVRLEREENVYDLHGVPTWGINYMCDKCGFITTAIQDHFGQYNFCPNCGAKMKDGDDE